MRVILIWSNCVLKNNIFFPFKYFNLVQVQILGNILLKSLEKTIFGVELNQNVPLVIKSYLYLLYIMLFFSLSGELSLFSPKKI